MTNIDVQHRESWENDSSESSEGEPKILITAALSSDLMRQNKHPLRAFAHKLSEETNEPAWQTDFNDFTSWFMALIPSS